MSDPSQTRGNLRDIFFSCMDLASKQRISDNGFDEKKQDADGNDISKYKTFCEDIDRGYKFILEFWKCAPRRTRMGLHAVDEGEKDDQVDEIEKVVRVTWSTRSTMSTNSTRSTRPDTHIQGPLFKLESFSPIPVKDSKSVGVAQAQYL